MAALNKKGKEKKAVKDAPIRVLVVDDSENDAVLMMHKIECGGYAPVFERVDTDSALAAALEGGQWDIILADLVMPHFSGLKALKLVQKTGLDVPFIMVSGKSGEDTAIEAMKAGAGDYVLKQNLSRLVPAIERELRDAGARREGRRTVEKLALMNRLYACLSNVNQLIVRTRDAQKIFEGACRIAVEDGAFRMAWVGLADQESRRVLPVASFGHVGDYLDGIRISVDDVPEGRGPTGTAIRTVGHFACQDIENDPRMLPWRDKALKCGYRACAAFPIMTGNKAIGAFNIYSDAPAFFDNDETGLLDEMAGDISFALDALLEEEKRKKTEEALRNEAAVSAALLKTAEVTTAYLNWDEIVEHVLVHLKKLVPFKSAAVFMLHGDGALTPQKALGAAKEELSVFYTIRPRIDEVPALERAADTKKAVVVAASERDSLIPEYLRRDLGVKEAIIAPILARDKAAGFLAANFDALPDDPRAVLVVQGVACQLGIAYESACLYEATQQNSMELAKKMEAIKVLHEIDRMILSTLDRDEMLTRVVMQITRLLPADAGGVAMLEPDGKSFRYVCGWDMRMHGGDLIPAAGCPAMSTFKSQKALVRANLLEEPVSSNMDKAFRDAGARSDMLIPLVTRGVGVGFIRLGSRRVAGFSMEDVASAEKLAFQVGIALDNTRLIADLEEMFVNTVSALSAAIDAKSPWTKGHSERVTRYATQIASRMGMSDAEVERLRLAGLLHDIGKISTYDVILDKPGKLTEEEFNLVKMHPCRGVEILSPIKQFKDILPAIHGHHERWDGSGYPYGLKGGDIPLMARILCVADSYDSMTADRPYRPAPGREYAVAEFRRCSGTQFDPDVVKIFLQII